MTKAQDRGDGPRSRLETQSKIVSGFASLDPSHIEFRRETEVQTACLDDESRIVAALVLAFGADPADRWMYPSPESYFRYFPDFFRALGGRAFECGTAYFIGDVQAAALWLPPGVQPDEEALMDVFQRSLTKDHQEALGAIVEQMGQYHPHEPHWYLPWIGTDPGHQRKGLGSTLLEHGLLACDQEKMPAYLEASSLESVPLYERHGFEVLGTIQVGTSPPITPMLRRPCDGGFISYLSK